MYVIFLSLKVLVEHQSPHKTYYTCIYKPMLVKCLLSGGIKLFTFIKIVLTSK